VPGGGGNGSGVVVTTESILTRELAQVETESASELAILREQLARKDETIWQLVSNEEGCVAILASSNAFLSSEQVRKELRLASGGAAAAGPPGASTTTADSPDGGAAKSASDRLRAAGAAAGITRRTQLKMAAVATVALDKAEEEAAEVAWKEVAIEPSTDTTPLHAEGIARFEAELAELDAQASEAHREKRQRADERVTEAFKAAPMGGWTYTATCSDGAIVAEGNASEHMLKGYIELPGVRAAALFDALIRPAAIRPLLHDTFGGAEHDVRGSEASGRESATIGDSTNELWRVTLSIPFSWYTRELSLWRAVRRHPQGKASAMVLKNGPRSAHRGHGAGSTWDTFSRTKPAELIGYNGLRVTEVEGGARVCFAWCCDLPGNSHSERRLRSSLSSFPRLCRDLRATARGYAPTEATRRAELVDTTGDGRVDKLAIDVLGDGIVDTMIELSDLPAGHGGGGGGEKHGHARVKSLPRPAGQSVHGQEAPTAPRGPWGRSPMKRRSSQQEQESDRNDFVSSKLLSFFGLEAL
jgi:hypothetical protein